MRCELPHEYVCVRLASSGVRLTLPPSAEARRRGMQMNRITACGMLLLAATGAARAQQAEPSTPSGGDNGEPVTVTITGIRHGIEDAIALKRDNTSIVEAIS